MDGNYRQQKTKADNGTPILPGVSPYENMGTRDAIRAFFFRNPGRFTARGLAERLQQDGYKTNSEKFSASVFTVCTELVKENALNSVFDGKIRWFFPK